MKSTSTKNCEEMKMHLKRHQTKKSQSVLARNMEPAN